jgi:hypothetical protein
LTAAEANYDIVLGLPFHKYKFDEAAAARAAGASSPSTSEIANTHVTLLSPTAAVIAYDRLIRRTTHKGATVVAETRAWALDKATGRWKQAHFHRSPKPGAAAAPKAA